MDNSFAYLGMQQDNQLRNRQLTLADLNAQRQQQSAGYQAAVRAQAQIRQAEINAQVASQRTAAQLADSQANRAYGLQSQRERLAQGDISDQRHAWQSNYDSNLRADQQRGQMQEGAHQFDVNKWEQEQQRQQQNDQFGATRYDRAYEFDAGQQQQRDLAQFHAADASQARAEQFGHADQSQAAQFQQQQSMAAMNAGLHSWMNQQDLSFKESMQLQSMQRAVGEVNADPNLTQEERAIALTHLKTGIDPMVMRQKMSQQRHSEEQTKVLEQQVARENALQAQNDLFHTGQVSARIVIDPNTGARYTTNRNGDIVELDKHQNTAERQKEQEKHKWLDDYVKSNQNPETGAQPSYKDALTAWQERETALSGDQAKPADAPPAGAQATAEPTPPPTFVPKHAMPKPFDEGKARTQAEKSALDHPDFAGMEPTAIKKDKNYRDKVDFEFLSRKAEHNVVNNRYVGKGSPQAIESASRELSDYNDHFLSMDANGKFSQKNTPPAVTARVKQLSDYLLKNPLAITDAKPSENPPPVHVQQGIAQFDAAIKSNPNVTPEQATQYKALLAEAVQLRAKNTPESKKRLAEIRKMLETAPTPPSTQEYNGPDLRGLQTFGG